MKVIVTGGAGLIGSTVVWRLNQAGIDDILIVDDLNTSDKWKNLVGLRYTDYLHKTAFLELIATHKLPFRPDAIIHMGACSATTENDADYLMENNYRYTKTLAEWSVAKKVRFIYASSAATYGDGDSVENGGSAFDDSIDRLPHLYPLNRYGYSKHFFDLHALRTGLLSQIVGLKFFNVFGPNEYHKGDMTSVVYKAFVQIESSGKLNLFRSYRAEYADGEQARDFVYVKDCVEVIWWLLNNPTANGIFNVGTGTARSWNDLGRAVFAAMGREPAIDYIPMPDVLQGKYQYFTQATTQKLTAAGCPVVFRSLEDSVADYVQNYLRHDQRHLGLR